MTDLKVIKTDWEPANRLIVTHISGDLDKEDVIRWEESLQAALDQVEDGGTFRIFVNLHGFTALNFDAHKHFRNIIPLTLAEYGWRVGYVAMFEEEASGLVLSSKRNIRCLAAAHCHQDETKIAKYESLYSSPNERFFTDPEMAEAWIRSIA
ncbi:hypothetical protein SAMN04487996_110207 [Dyadobacter soli]|uniref:SpoIIAA-like n=1 Tax=Dyadobacter soli TaxID=659014 RepID=A0A1G7KSK7_9BACT|nr:hypothetical protein [Dyadobacter soli]SDF40202.1 hypothetical protein SAMN04487996_110207 [Dyadobacter soli]